MEASRRSRREGIRSLPGADTKRSGKRRPAGQGSRWTRRNGVGSRTPLEGRQCLRRDAIMEAATSMARSSTSSSRASSLCGHGCAPFQGDAARAATITALAPSLLEIGGAPAPPWVRNKKREEIRQSPPGWEGDRPACTARSKGRPGTPTPARLRPVIDGWAEGA